MVGLENDGRIHGNRALTGLLLFQNNELCSLNIMGFLKGSCNYQQLQRRVEKEKPER